MRVPAIVVLNALPILAVAIVLGVPQRRGLPGSSLPRQQLPCHGELCREPGYPVLRLEGRAAREVTVCLGYHSSGPRAS
jgi:hypothetical protein